MRYGNLQVGDILCEFKSASKATHHMIKAMPPFPVPGRSQLETLLEKMECFVKVLSRTPFLLRTQAQKLAEVVGITSPPYEKVLSLNRTSTCFNEDVAYPDAWEVSVPILVSGT